ncbi:MAG: TfoX/Sxy family protein [Bacteroidetes bacterium]|nr:TfoX/Sxy family protein [Bacteroidota bacterium]MBK8144177.1 TfoX/Sxy family protein [Bacteroidota bacterium]MBP6314385.1 TfoX/Sxy family protein [Chitinophagaceae bacterium]
MAYNEITAQRIAQVLIEKNVSFTDKKMFSGICFLLDDKMLCGTHIDKKSGEELLLCRVGEEAYATVIERDDCIPMQFTGKPMVGFVFVLESGCRSDKDLAYWIQLCLDFNPLAKKSKKKK